MKPTLGEHVVIDVPRLLVSRLLVQANSGGGKSWTLRRLLEQTYGTCQHLVLDPEGEFHTLRERFDYVLAGKGGDCPADLKSAALLARRLLELGVSAIVDISELGAARTAFVQLFLQALVDAPRELWHPALVVVDEAHLFCPEKGRGEAASTGAVIDLMTRGRKRGFCGVLATQRISKLNKDAAAECNNKLVGRTGLDTDVKRAAEELGLVGREEATRLRKLKPGQFYAYGPALTVDSDVVLFTVGTVKTSHPEAGTQAPPPTPPAAAIRKLLGQLADLPHEAEAEARSADELRARVRALERELRAARTAAPAPKVETKIVEKRLIDEKHVKRLERATAKLQDLDGRLRMQLDEVLAATRDARKQLHVAEAWAAKPPAAQARPPAPTSPAPQRVKANGTGFRTPKPLLERVADSFPGKGLVPAQQRIIDILALLEQLGIASSRETLAAWVGQHPNTKAFVNNLGALRSLGFVEGFAITDAGRAAAQAIAVPTFEDALERIYKPLSPAQRRILDVVRQHSEGLAREALAGELGVHPNTKAFVNNVGALRSRQLVTRGWPLRPGDVLRALPS